jgi:flagellar M-ring protein FliF
VTINMFPGRNLDEDQVAAIAHMVSSSVPNLDTSHVTIVDQQGRLLTSMESSAEMGMTTSQFSYRKKLEQYLVKRIEDLISPIVGPGGVRAQVATELDFSFTEQTQESFNPDLPAIRSEQTTEEQMTGSGAAAGGVPGALTNQPPEGGTTAAGGGNQAAQAGGETAPTQSNRRITRNYELDRTISHVRLPAGTIRRLSIAVVIDDKTTVDDAGAVTRQPLTEDELGRITNLVKEAVGFSQRRGDSVSVINSAFSQPAPAEPLPEPGLLEQPWVWDAGKIALGGIGVIFLIFGLLKPVMRSLAEKGAMLPPMPTHGQLEHDQLSLTGGQTAQLPASSYDTHLTTAKSMAQQDPKRVAQVVKQWVSDDG